MRRKEKPQTLLDERNSTSPNKEKSAIDTGSLRVPYLPTPREGWSADAVKPKDGDNAVDVLLLHSALPLGRVVQVLDGNGNDAVVALDTGFVDLPPQTGFLVRVGLDTEDVRVGFARAVAAAVIIVAFPPGRVKCCVSVPGSESRKPANTRSSRCKTRCWLGTLL